LSHHCNFVWSATPPARCGDSVLSTALSPTRLAQWSTSPYFGRLPCCPTPALNAFSFPHLHSLKSLAHCLTPVLWDWFSALTPFHCQWYSAIHCFVPGSICPEAALDYVPGEVGEAFVHGVWRSPLGLQIYTGGSETGWQGGMVHCFLQGT
jgi:hypothetical protein